MDHITLQHTGLNVSRVCFGTMTFGGQTDEPTAARMVDLCLDRGINFFDTANAYTGGTSETILGKVLGSRRSKIVLASKVANKVGDAPDQQGLSRAAINRAIDETLKRLGTDYLDIYYMHLPDRNTPIEESLEAMNGLVKQGKVRYLASSNYASWQMVEMLWLAQKNGWTAPFIAQPMYNLIARGIEQEYLEMSARFGISNIVYNPLAGGLLTGKQNRQAPVAGSRFDANKMYLDRYWHDQQFDAVERLIETAKTAGRSLVSVALNWLYHHTSIQCIILGASRVEHLEQNRNSLEDGPLSPETLAICDETWQGLRGSTPKYNR
jgi:aryl-alcohol dehydrogenase-like predicted oxidoreductase